MSGSSSQPDSAAIRQFLTEAFSDEELTTVCFDFFRDVYEGFAAGMSKWQKIQLLLDYCQRREVIPNLLAAIQRVRPEQYKERFPQPLRVEARPESAKPVRDPKQVFVSHAHEDAEFAHRLANDLQQNGWHVWIAPDSIRPGEMWGEGIDRGMDESGVLVLVLTPRSVQSPWVRKETYAAIQLESQGRIRFIPLEVEPCDVPGLWSTYQRISFQSDYGSGLTALLDTLEPERRARREREAQEKAAREEAERLERELEARRKAAQTGAERQARPAAEKAEAERLVRERREHEVQEEAAQEEAARQETERLERERLEREQVAREAEHQARLKEVPSQPEPVAGSQTADVLQPTRWTRPHLPHWALPHLPRWALRVGGVLAVLVLIVIACLMSPTLYNTLLKSAATQTAVAISNATPFPIVTRVWENDGMVMVYVPAGEFLMGSWTWDDQADAIEKPQHKVYLDAFWIDRTEVTNAQYQKCVQAGACDAPGYASGSKLNGDNQPVVVDWDRTHAYCQWAGRQLPTEAQWEKAARGTDGRIYPWGNQPATCEYAVMDDGTGSGCGQGEATWPVGSKLKGASPYGALDMAGNVREWVADWYDAGYYANSPSRNPQGPSSGVDRVARGGSFASGARLVRGASRTGVDPRLWYYDRGFRCVCVPGSSSGC